ncbi:hypothetical protein F4680DRAFT_450404 [Xylaria scruposa]|nr:hypothetical protein F4680DRAFT_450404 [Xylaria scruposa]
MASIHTPSIVTTSLFGWFATFQSPPLLTQFSVASECSRAWYYKTDTPGYVWSDAYHAWSFCAPYSGLSVDIYSPGICPLGQELKLVTKTINYDDQGSTDTVYRGYCCGTDFNLGITPQNSAEYTEYHCLSSFEPPVTAYLTTDQEHRFWGTTVLNSPVIAKGSYIIVYWHEKDLSSFPESLAASLRAGMGLPAFPTSTMRMTTPTESVPTTISTNPDAGRQNSSVHMPKGVIAGISVGVGVAVLLIGALGYLTLSRRWKKPGRDSKQQDKTLSAMRTNSFVWIRRIMRWKRDLPDLPEMDQGQNIFKYFRGGTWRAELHGTHTHNPNDGSQVSYDHNSTAVIGDPIELEGSIPVRQETVSEAVSEAGHEQN